ncbi:MAG: SBBP repeat-containing protein, partial [Vicingaceae bacterium]|nr:SBBP repeat-containing protein [Vicingaceae bacterium]
MKPTKQFLTAYPIKYYVSFFGAILILILHLGNSCFAQPSLAWAKNMGGINYDFSTSMTIDDSGNVYTTGRFQGTADFDPGAGTYNLISSGSSFDIFVSKLDAAGNFVWAKKMTGTSSNSGRSIAVDGSGNVYTTGSFQGTVDFDPGVGTYNLTTSGSNDYIFVSKLDAAGNFVWAKKMGGTGFNSAQFITTDNSGNVYITGCFENTFNPYNLTSAGAWDIFISKLDVAGNFVWAKRIGGIGNDIGKSIAIDGSGNFYFTGNFNGTVDFDPGAGIYNLTSAGSYDVFISKLDANGNFVWAKKMGGTDDELSFSIAVDNSGNVYSTGGFRGTADFDPGVGIYNLTLAGGIQDIFVSKLDANGNFLWAKSMGGSDYETGFSIAVDDSENVYSTGGFRGTADFNPGVGTYNLSSAGSDDIFVSKLDANGNFVWAKSIGGMASDISNSIVIDGCKNLYISGNFSSTADFDPDAGTYNLTSAGSWDVFIVKFNQAIPTGNSISPTLCAGDSLFAGGTWQTVTGIYYDTLMNVCGSDSILTTNLTVIPTASGSDLQTACNSLTWIDNVTYTSSTNTPNFTIVGGAANGCDSVVTLDLTINTTQNGTDLQTACNSFTWLDNVTYTTSINTPTFTIVGGAANGCDSVVTLDLTINTTQYGTDVQTACNSFTWLDNVTYTTSINTPTFTIVGGAANGCDSVVTLDLTINTTQNGIDLQTACNSFTWLDNVTYTTSTNTPTFTIVGGAANGCDSVVTLDLTINTTQ